MAALTALLMIGDGTGSSLIVALALGDSDVLGLSETDGEAGEELDVVGSDATGSSPSSVPHATTVAATIASPAMAVGILVLRSLMT
jgi:hypothetical protein